MIHVYSLTTSISGLTSYHNLRITNGKNPKSLIRKNNSVFGNDSRIVLRKGSKLWFTYKTSSDGLSVLRNSSVSGSRPTIAGSLLSTFHKKFPVVYFLLVVAFAFFKFKLCPTIQPVHRIFCSSRISFKSHRTLSSDF